MNHLRLNEYQHNTIVEMDISTQFFLPDSIESKVSGEQDLGMWILHVSLEPKKGSKPQDLLNLRNYIRRVDL
jgi:hypothetical protein